MQKNSWSAFLCKGNSEDGNRKPFSPFRLPALRLLLVLSTWLYGQSTAAQDAHPNIIFIAIDDMNDWAGFLNTHPQVQTPHMDSLAAKGINFTNAHCPAPLCGPSRSAILSGVWPTTNGVYTNEVNYRKDLSGWVSLPEHFRQNGYYVMGAGKIFHAGGNNMPQAAFDEYGGKGAASAPFAGQELSIKNQQPFHEVTKNGKTFLLPLNGIPADRYWSNSHTFDWGAVDLPDTLFADTQTANWAIDKLQQQQDKPFFLAVGFARPHQPLFNPKRFHDRYPLSSIAMPVTIDNDLDDVPRAGREIALAAATSGLHKSVEAYGEWEHAVSSYLAAISYVDELVGNIMQALKASRYADNTIVVLWSDHGWHLGEKEHWGKGTGWFRATRVPFIIVPSKRHSHPNFQPNIPCDRMVNLLDLAPTLAELSNIPLRQEWEGNSLVPLIQNPAETWQAYTHTTFGYGNHSITTPRWQYLHYFDGTAELYDLQLDPEEFTNLANEPKYAEIKRLLHTWLPKEPQWKHFIRYHNFKALVPADGSPLRLYNLAYQDQVNEQQDVATAYPQVVAKIEGWLATQQPAGKYLWME
ncbi:MAG: sulfatase [Saprospiraceae bacterium]